MDIFTDKSTVSIREDCGWDLIEKTYPTNKDYLSINFSMTQIGGQRSIVVSNPLPPSILPILSGLGLPLLPRSVTGHRRAGI
jgi:hypothetical protein